MKTIWILNHYAMTPEQGGGTRHYNFARELVERGYQVYIFSSAHIHNTEYSVLSNKEKSREDVIDGIHWIWIQTKHYTKNGGGRIRSMIDYYLFMTKHYSFYKRPDVIIGSSVHPLACLAGIKISKKVNAKCVSEIRDLWPQTLIDMGKLNKNSLLSKILYKLEKYIYIKSESIIVTTPGMIEYIAKTGISRDKIIYINNGVSVSAFDKNISEKSNEIDKISLNDGNLFKCIYTGAIGEANYIENIIRAAQILESEGYSNIRFIIVGSGPEKKILVETTETLKLNNIKFYNPIKKDSIPALLNQVDVNIFNLKKIEILKYGLSANKLFDYMCSGKPIVFACETTSDYVRESGCGISIEPENPRAMAESIIKVYNMSEVARKEMGLRGRKYVEKSFDIPVLVDKLEGVINS